MLTVHPPQLAPSDSRPDPRSHVASSYPTRGSVNLQQEEEVDYISDTSDCNGQSKSLHAGFNRWIRVTNPKSKFKGLIGQLKGIRDKDTNRLYVHIYSQDENGVISYLKSSIGANNSYELLNEDEIMSVKFWLGKWKFLLCFRFHFVLNLFFRRLFH